MRALLFPGQGSQYIGMGKELHDTFSCAKEVFQEVDHVLSQNLSSLMFAGDESDLRLTENTQPALMAVSVAVMRVLEKEMGYTCSSLASFTAGHSLGEYSALCATGVYNLEATARLLRLRGQAMQEAVPVGEGGMAALIGATFDQAEDVVAQAAEASGGVCEIANDNAPGQIVISGHQKAIDSAIDIAKEKSIKRALPLPVSAPFHSSLMAPAAKRMEGALANEATQGMPSLTLVSNVTASPVENEDQIAQRLVDQITGRVRWVESMAYMVDQGVNEVIEIGAGKVLSGLMKRINKEVSSYALETPADLEAFHKEIAA